MIKKMILCLFLVVAIMGRTYPLYKQCDGRWANEILGTSESTICQSGCLMTSVTMALAATGYDFTPSTFNQWLTSHGGFYDGGEYIWASTNVLGLRFQGKVSNSQIRPHLDAGYVVIMWVRGGSHWVLAHGYNGDTIYVNDSGFPNTSYNIN